MGDLIATCSSNQSRNFRVGYHLAKGESLEVVLAELGQVAEGVRTTRIVYEFAKERAIEMPITEAVHAVLFDGKDPINALTDLMTRDPKPETAG